MKGSASGKRKGPAAIDLAADKPRPGIGLFVAALVHAGALAWALGHTGEIPPPMRLPFGGMLAAATTIGLLLVFLIAAFARRNALSFVVVPPMLVAGAAAHAVSTVGSSSYWPAQTLPGLLAFGALGLALNLSFGAAAIAARVSSGQEQVRLGESPAFRLAALGLVAVLGVATVSEQLAPLAALCAAVGILSLGALLNAVERNFWAGSAMAELISAMVLSLGAVWTASIAAGASRAASAPDDWEAAQNAMQFAWLSAMPLILAVLVALSPRVTATGAGVKRGRSTVLATLVGAVTCVGLIEVVMTHTSSILSARASAAPAGTSEPGAKSAVAVRPVQKPVAKQKPAKTRPQPGSASSIGTSSPAVTPAGELERIVLAFESEQTKLSIDVKVDGPMLPRDARQGVEKSFERLVNCYEASERRGDPSELRLGLLIDDAGSVKQAELIEPAGSTSKYVTCVQLAFYRSGFSAPPKLTWLELSVSFLPKEWTGTR